MTTATTIDALVHDLKRCQGLKEAGFPQETALNWVYGCGEPYVTAFKPEALKHCTPLCAAPTFQEIWERLPRELTFCGTARPFLSVSPFDGRYGVGYEYIENMGVHALTLFRASAVSAAADLWLWCATNGYLEG